jgi:hypothetical protein
MGHVVHSGAPGHESSMHYSTKSAPGHVTPNLCFCNRWDLKAT